METQWCDPVCVEDTSDAVLEILDEGFLDPELDARVVVGDYDVCHNPCVADCG